MSYLLEKNIEEYQKMPEENMNQEFTFKKNYLTEEINRNELISKKHKKFSEF